MAARSSAGRGARGAGRGARGAGPGPGPGLGRAAPGGPGRGRLAAARGWGDPVEWAAAGVAATEPLAEGLRGVVLEVPEAVSGGYVSPGQFLQVRVGGEDAKPAFLAVAAAPGAQAPGTLELLVKDAGEDSPAGLLCRLPAGGELEVSPVMGKGFPVERARDAGTVLLFASGSGISPIRALVESGELSRGAHERVVLFHGVRDAAHQPYAARLLAWGADLGVRVVEVHSRPAPGWSGARGYVQDALEAERENLGDLSRAAAFVVGQKEMAEALKAGLGAAGTPEENVLFNF